MIFQVEGDRLIILCDDHIFGNLIRTRRESLGMSRVDVITLMDGRVTATTLRNWETEFTLPSLGKLRKLGAALQLEVELLVKVWLISRQNRDQVVAHAV